MHRTEDQIPYIHLQLVGSNSFGAGTVHQSLMYTLQTIVSGRSTVDISSVTLFVGWGLFRTAHVCVHVLVVMCPCDMPLAQQQHLITARHIQDMYVHYSRCFTPNCCLLGLRERVFAGLVPLAARCIQYDHANYYVQ